MDKDEVVIQVKNVSKNFILPHEKVSTLKGLFTSVAKNSRKQGKDVQHALNDISFEVKKGEFFGIVGRNGSGKSTMLKILASIYQPSSGSINVKGKLVPFIELGVGFNAELTGRENVFLNGAMLGFSEDEVEAMYDDIVSFAELHRFMDQKLKNYSSGMQVRLAFSMATRSEADVLLVDEVLAVGDADFQRKCFEYFKTLKKNEKTVVFVTHDMNAVREYCDRAILIEDSRLIEQGPASKVSLSYTKMFIESTDSVQNKIEQTRWGDKAVTFESAKLSSKKLLEKDKELIMTLSIIANKSVENPIVGFLLKNSSNVHLMGTNTTILNKPLPDMKTGDKLTLTWKIPNIFNDGNYYIDPAVVYKGGNQVSDWWEEALAFKAVIENPTSYAVNPPIEVSLQETLNTKISNNG